jgi:hypothetical protein
MRTKEFHVTSGSEFGKRVADMEPEKKLIAQAVLSRVLWPPNLSPKNPIFVSDGSSASYVWCYYLREWTAKGSAAEPLTV